MAARKKVKKVTRVKKMPVKKSTNDFFGQSMSLSHYLNTLKTFPSRKTYYMVLLISGLLILAYLASRFLVVAWVDKQPILWSKYYQELDKKYGRDLKEQLIVERLLENEAKKKGVNVTDQDISAEMKKVEEAQGGADQLNQILQVQGVSQEEFKKIVRLQTLKQRVFGKDITISDDEVNKYIEKNQEQFKEVTDKTREQVKEQLKQQKINENFKKFLQDALKSSRVIRV